MKNLIYIFTFILTSTAIAQNTTSIAFEKQKMQQAKMYNDESIILNSMYSLIAMEGPRAVIKIAWLMCILAKGVMFLVI